MILPDKVYNVVKWVLLTVVPALNVLITSLCALYGWTWGAIVVGTIDAFAVFFGVVLGVGSYRYAKLQASTDDTKG